MAKTYTNPDPKRNNNGIEVTFDNGKPKIIIESINDNPIQKVVVAKTNDGIYTIWSDNAYDNIGDWTTQQAIDKVKELALAGKKK